MRKPTTDPNRAFVRTIVPATVHENALWMARYSNITVAYLYTLILTRALFDIDRKSYADQLWADFRSTPEGDNNHA